MPPDALDLVSWPALAACFAVGIVFGALLLWQSPARRSNIGATTVLAVAYALTAGLFISAFRAFQFTEHWGRTVGTGIEFAVIGLGAGMGLWLRKH